MKMKVLIFIIVSLLSLTTTRAQIGVAANAGVYLPIGELSNSYNTGYGGEASFIYRFNPNFEIALTGGMSVFQADEETLENRLLEELEDINEEINVDAEIDVEAPLNLYPLVFSIKYLYGKKKFKPYFFFEGGVFFYDIIYSGSINITNGPEIALPESIEKESSTTLALGGGFLSSLTKKLFLDVKARWSIMNNIKLVEADSNEELRGIDKTVQTISLSAGLSYYF